MKTRRKFSRIDCKLKASVQIDNLLIVEATIINISMKGAFFELADSCIFKESDKWRLKIRLPGSEISLNVMTEVIHAHKRLVGVKFVQMDKETEDQLGRLIERSASGPYKMSKDHNFPAGADHTV